jgi:hypothetical protein
VEAEVAAPGVVEVAEDEVVIIISPEATALKNGKLSHPKNEQGYFKQEKGIITIILIIVEADAAGVILVA